jgi:hypothetical protein
VRIDVRWRSGDLARASVQKHRIVEGEAHPENRMTPSKKYNASTNKCQKNFHASPNKCSQSKKLRLPLYHPLYLIKQRH